MDPYLEGAEWSSVHAELSSEIARQLAPKLRPKYVARTIRRFITELPEVVAITAAPIYPDVSVTETPRREPSAVGPATVAVAPLELVTAMPVDVPQITIEIRDVANRELVTAIEVLSPTNKRGAGYREYLDKRWRLLRSRAHLIEIDLLRLGQRVPMEQSLPPAPYFVIVSRAERRPIVEVWPIQLHMRLPIVPVPLLVGDPDVLLDLQAALNSVYDSLNYDLSVDYTRPPDVPLEGTAEAWAADHLRAAGFAA
jgi:hypothetical protein